MSSFCYSKLYTFYLFLWLWFVITLEYHSCARATATSTAMSRITNTPIIKVNKRKFTNVKSMRPTSSHISSNFGLRDLKVAIAGGLAGGIANAILFPLDTFKTMRQTDKSIKSLSSAYQRLQEKGFYKVYSGFLASVIGSTSSSAIYFGTYEYSKRLINLYFHDVLTRPLIHSLSAISGNVLSSIVFVPKDVIKQQMQSLSTQAAIKSSLSSSGTAATAIGRTMTQNTNLLPIKWTTISLIKHIFLTKGLKGFYPSYRVTLLRNIPGAVLRFTVYEELKHFFMSQIHSHNHSHSQSSSRDTLPQWRSVMFLVAGGVASSLSSGLTTPLDVVKTRLATGMIAPGKCVYIMSLCVNESM